MVEENRVLKQQMTEMCQVWANGQGPPFSSNGFPEFTPISTTVIPVSLSDQSYPPGFSHYLKYTTIAGTSVACFQKFDYILFNDPPVDVVANSSNVATVIVVDDVAKKKFEKDNKVVRGHLLNHMTNPLFDLFINYKSAKLIWDSLEKKYSTDDSAKKKYAVEKRIKFQMVDDKTVMEQEYENVTVNILNEGMEMCEILQANVLLENTFVKDMIKGKQKKGYVKKQNYFNKLEGHIQKSKGPCYRQGQSSKNEGKVLVQANLTEGGDVIVAVVVEANMVANKTDWILDTGALRHLCANKELFHNFEESADGKCVYIGNSTTTGVMGEGKILLKLTSGKPLGLNNVLYVPSLRRNLDSGALLNNAGLKLIFESDEVIIFRGGDFVGKGYFSVGLFVLNIAQEITNNANTFNSAYIDESIDLWYGRLGHNQNIPKKTFKNVTSRKIELFELAHSDLADFKNTVSKGGKKYYITFVNDFSRYTKVYLLKSKDEAEKEDLKTNNEAIRSIDASFLKEAIKSELDSIVSNLTWDLSDLPKRGFNQKKDIYYFDIYSPVTKIATIRTFVALAAIHDLVIHQMNVKTTFLNGDLEEERYISQPEGFVIQVQENKVCKLRKSLYGLKKAPKQWYENFNSTLVGYGFVVNASDTCVYSKMIGSDCMIRCLYVNDMLIFGPSVDVVKELKNFLSSKFEMKDLGEADMILGYISSHRVG
ncbi:uncharacterized protein LOC142162833 [Nicotiana tabacum]|uniref:Uncharacterized protein LOC142162833 n=1 Tax=Nicotiana tabacum TaxID=4097 RepID=A0AC58RT45_TOBAC